MTAETLSFLSPFAAGTSIGVAIEVPQPYARQLRELREAVEGGVTPEIIGPHVTLLPPTNLPDFDLGPVERQLERAARSVAPFDIELLGSGTFRPTSQVVFAALVEGSAQCDVLQAQVRQGPLAHELRFAYHPHVTVAQDVPEAQLDAAERALAQFRARFRVTGFVLYELGPDAAWHRIRTYELTGRPGRAGWAGQPPQG